MRKVGGRERGWGCLGIVCESGDSSRGTGCMRRECAWVHMYTHIHTHARICVFVCRCALVDQ